MGERLLLDRGEGAAKHCVEPVADLPDEVAQLVEQDYRGLGGLQRGDNLFRVRRYATVEEDQQVLLKAAAYTGPPVSFQAGD